MTAAEAALIMMSGSTPAVLEPLSVSENGTYTPREGVDGFNEVTVAVPLPVSSLTVTANGTYTAPEGTGYTPVYVNVPDNADRIAELEQQIATLEQEKSELLNKVGYTFPEGTTMEQIKQLTASGASSEVTVSSTGDVCARVEFSYDETKINKYSVIYGAWSKSEQKWLKSYGFRNSVPIGFNGVEKENDNNVKFYFTNIDNKTDGTYWNSPYPANQYQNGWTYFDNTVQTYTVVN